MIEANKFKIIKYRNKANEEMLNPAALNDWPVVYIIKEEDSNGFYVGQTNNFLRRLGEHEKNNNRFAEESWVIYHEGSNKSFAYFLESEIIDRLSIDFGIRGDSNFRLTNKIGESMNSGGSLYNFYNKKFYNLEVPKIWKEIINEKIAHINYDELSINEIYDLSPYKKTTKEQDELIEELVLDIDSCSLSTVNGFAGTGKTLTLIKTALIFKEREKERIASALTFGISNIRKKVIAIHSAKPKKWFSIKKIIDSIHPEFSRDILVLENLGEIKTYSDKGVKIDHLLIDEGQLLRVKHFDGMETPWWVSEKNEGSFDDEIEFINSFIPRHTIFYDELQDTNAFTIPLSKIRTEKYLKRFLYKNHRIKTNIDFYSFIKSFLSGDKSKSFDFKKDKYELECFDKPEDLYAYVKSKRGEKSRLLASLDTVPKKAGSKLTPYEDKRGNKIKNWFEKYNIEVIWNSTTKDWVEKSSINEVGSIHAIHGSTLDYSGVIIGDDISMDDNGKINLNYNKRRFNRKTNDEDAVQKTLNTYYVLLTRAEKGMGIYIPDNNLRAFFKNLINN